MSWAMFVAWVPGSSDTCSKLGPQAAQPDSFLRVVWIMRTSRLFKKTSRHFRETLLPCAFQHALFSVEETRVILQDPGRRPPLRTFSELPQEDTALPPGTNIPACIWSTDSTQHTDFCLYLCPSASQAVAS